MAKLENPSPTAPPSQRSLGPPVGQLFNKPVSVDTPDRSARRHWDQSAPLSKLRKRNSQVNRHNHLFIIKSSPNPLPKSKRIKSTKPFPGQRPKRQHPPSRNQGNEIKTIFTVLDRPTFGDQLVTQLIGRGPVLACLASRRWASS